MIIVVLIFIPGMILSQIVRHAIAFYPNTPNAWHFMSMAAVGLALHVPVYLIWTHYLTTWYRCSDPALAGCETLDQHWMNATLWVGFAIFAWPVLIGVILVGLVRSDRVNNVLETYGMGSFDRTPSAWDWAVNTTETRWVRIQLRNGSWVAGWYGVDSFASLYKPNKDIYLEEMWYLDAVGDIDQQDPNTDGVWIAHDQIAYMTFQRGQDDSGPEEESGE